MEECNTLAMMYNNEGASNIQRKNYQQAIMFLSEALKLAEQVSRHLTEEMRACHVFNTNSAVATAATMNTPCTCHHCKLETCMMNKGNGQQHNGNNRVLSSMKDGSASLKDNVKTEDDVHDCCHDHNHNYHHHQGFFLYTKPLFASSISIQEKHYMGESLSLMILFNLALAYQLEGGSILLCKSRKLYELCYQMQMETHHQCSLWFTMCISNNLSEIHRQEGGCNAQYSTCLQHLLSTMMYVVDCHLTSSSSSLSSRDNEDTPTFPPTRNSQRRKRRKSYPNFHQFMMQTAMDGFFLNSSRVILQSRVASAA